MNQIPLWFERQFDFSFPAELLPNLCARLRGTPARLEEALSHCPESRRKLKPQGKWSMQEHAGHLANLEPLWLARLYDYKNGSTELSPADLQNRATDAAQYNDRLPEDILAEFRGGRTILLAQIERLDTALFSGSIPHPRLKVPMRLVDHLYFVAEHDDHHLAHMWELATGGR